MYLHFSHHMVKSHTVMCVFTCKGCSSNFLITGRYETKNLRHDKATTDGNPIVFVFIFGLTIVSLLFVYVCWCVILYVLVWDKLL